MGIRDRGDSAVLVVSNWTYSNDEVKISEILEVIPVILTETA